MPFGSTSSQIPVVALSPGAPTVQPEVFSRSSSARVIVSIAVTMYGDDAPPPGAAITPPLLRNSK